MRREGFEWSFADVVIFACGFDLFVLVSNEWNYLWKVSFEKWQLIRICVKRYLKGISQKRHLKGISQERHLKGIFEKRYSKGISEKRHLKGIFEKRYLEGISRKRHLKGIWKILECVFNCWLHDRLRLLTVVIGGKRYLIREGPVRNGRIICRILTYTAEVFGGLRHGDIRP